MNLSDKDKLYNWHPYTQHQTAAHHPAIVKGKDALLWDENGKEYIDAIASWWVNPFGHSNQFVADAIYKQLTTLEHVLFGGFTHEPAVVLAEKLNLKSAQCNITAAFLHAKLKPNKEIYVNQP